MPASSLHRLTTALVLPGEPALKVAAEVFVPALLASPPVALVCLPGGAMNRGYFNLQSQDDESYSFAAAMTARGFIVITIDHLGVGDSDKPADSYALTLERIAQANADATAQLLNGLRDGSLIATQPALPTLQSIGVGHSMGAMVTTVQQALAQQHAGIALLGFSTRGLPEYVSAEARELSKDSLAVRAETVRLARQMFLTDYPSIRVTQESKVVYGGSNAEPAGMLALKPAIEKLLPVPAYQSMLPGNIAPEAAQITVPVFLGLGDKDMAGSPHAIPAAFPCSRDVSLLVLPGTGHNHFVFASRHLLFERLAVWARMIASPEPFGRGRAAPASDTLRA